MKKKYYQINIPSNKPVFTNSLKIKRQMEANAKLVLQEIGIRVSWDKSKEVR